MVAVNLFGSIYELLHKQDIDQEVKQNSIIAMAQLISVSHKVLAAQEIGQVMQIFHDRLNNELTREASLKALVLIGKSKVPVDIQDMGNFTGKLVDLLHKAEVQIHSSTLNTILVLLKRYGP